MSSVRHSFAFLLLCIFAAGGVLADEEERGVVSGTGAASITRPPDTMRLQIGVMGRGATLKDALTALKDRVSKAKTQLTALGAEKDSIKISEPHITELQNDRSRQMQMMMMRSRMRGGKANSKTSTPIPVLVSSMLTAEWKLTAKLPDELLLAVHPIQEKIKAADLAGSKEAEKLTPEQEELLEEAAQEYGYDGSDESKPGQPVFLFVSRVADAERDQALADAYDKARKQASRLASAAGAQLGRLKSLNSHESSANDSDEYGGGGFNFSYRQMQMLNRRQANSEKDENEAFAVQPGPVKFLVTVTASFEVEPK